MVGGPTVQLENVAGGTGRLIEPLPEMPPEGQNSFRKGDVLFSKLRPYLAKSVLVDRPLQGSGEFLCLRPSKAIDPRYLRYTTLSRPWLDHANMTSYGAKMPRTSWEGMSDFEVPEVPIESQRRIADFLDDRVSRIDRIIAARRAQRELTGSHRVSQLSQLMDNQASSSGLAPLRRFCTGIEQGSSPVGEDRRAEPSESGVLKTSSVYRGFFFPERHKAISSEDGDSRYLVRTGDVIVIRGSGSAELVGDAAVTHVEESGPKLQLSDLTYRLRGLDLAPQYAVMALISSRGRSELGSLVRQGSGPAKARGDDILSISVPVATFDEQQQCVRTYAKVRDQWQDASNELGRSIDLLTEYKSSLITAAVTGELDVSTTGSTIPG